MKMIPCLCLIISCLRLLAKPERPEERNPGGAKDPGESGNGTSAVGLWLLGDKGLKASQWQAVTGITMAHNEQTLVIYSYLGNDQFEIRSTPCTSLTSKGPCRQVWLSFGC